MDKYEEALERAREIYNAPVATIVTRTFLLEQIFPELKESEDEKIRKEIITYLSNELHNVKQLTPRTNEFEAWIAYLQKRREPLTPEEKMNHPLYLEGFDVGRQVGEVVSNSGEWSEEDGLARDFLLKHIEQSIKVLESLKKETYIGSKGLSYVATDIANWQSARSFILSLRPHWKPSEEQMEVLQSEIKCCYACGTHERAKQLETLYIDLKKL